MSSIYQNNYIQATFHAFLGENIELAHIQTKGMLSQPTSSSESSAHIRKQKDNQPQPSEQADLARRQILDFFQNLNNENLSTTDLESFAESYLDSYRQAHPKGNSLRYCFKKRSSTEELLKLVFDRAFQSKPEVVIAAAEQVEGVSFYPKWKSICWIKAPAGIGSILGSVVCKVVITVSVFFLSCHAGYRGYYAVEHLLRARAIPLLINNASLSVIKTGNAIWDAAKRIKENRSNILISFFLIKQLFAYGPRIPYVTEVVNNLSVFLAIRFLVSAPQSLGAFVFGKTLDLVNESRKLTGSVAALFTGAANSQNEVRLAICRKKAYDTWKKVIQSKVTPN